MNKKVWKWGKMSVKLGKIRNKYGSGGPAPVLIDHGRQIVVQKSPLVCVGV